MKSGGGFLEWRRFEITCQRIVMMMKSGVSLHRSVQILVDDATTRQGRQLLHRMATDLEQGIPFPKAFRWILPRQFHTMLGPIAHIPNVAVFLTRWQSRVALRREMIVEARKRWVYPLILLVSTLGTILFFIQVLVPQYSEFFKQSHIPLPSIIVVLLRGVGWASSIPGSITILGGMVLAALTVWPTIVRFVKQRLFVHSDVSDGFWMMGVLLQSNVSLHDAFKGIVSAKRNRREWVGFFSQVENGGSFSDNAYRFLSISPFHRELLRCGESGGDLGSVLLEVAAEIDQQALDRMERLLGQVQPILLLVSAGAILMSIYITMAPVTSLIDSV